jgi:hypothetical protein
MFIMVELCSLAFPLTVPHRYHSDTAHCFLGAINLLISNDIVETIDYFYPVEIRL